MHNFKNLTPIQKMAISLGFFGLIVIGIVLLTVTQKKSATEDPNGSVSSPPAEELSAVSDVVLAFGQKMKQVSVLAPAAQVQTAMDTHYKALVSTELLATWKAKPDEAPGRTVSSPWPEKIEVGQVTQISEGKYKVMGNVIEITADYEAKGGPAAIYPVTIEVENQDGVWLITKFERGPYGEVPKPLTVVGFYTCLPHADTTGPQTDECALGIGRDQSDAFFALDTQDVGFDAIMGLGTGDKIEVQGLFTPTNQLSTNQWQKYRMDGIIRVQTIKVISKD